MEPALCLDRHVEPRAYFSLSSLIFNLSAFFSDVYISWAPFFVVFSFLGINQLHSSLILTPFPTPYKNQFQSILTTILPNILRYRETKRWVEVSSAFTCAETCKKKDSVLIKDYSLKKNNPLLLQRDCQFLDCNPTMNPGSAVRSDEPPWFRDCSFGQQDYCWIAMSRRNQPL